MACGDTALMIALLRRLKVEMNGEVVQQMRNRGLDYALNYGVSAITIRDIAAEYTPNHSLALLLFQQQVRELKLAAFYIDDPACVTDAQMDKWVAAIESYELAEHAVSALFQKVPGAGKKVYDWLGMESDILLYTALMLLGKTVGTQEGQGTANEFRTAYREDELLKILNRITSLTQQNRISRPLCNALSVALKSCATYSEAISAKVTELLNEMERSTDPLLQYAASEARWQIEYAKR